MEETSGGPQSPSSSCFSDLSDLFPRKLRYSEEILPLQFGEPLEAAPAPTLAPKGLRPVKVFARIKPADDDTADGGSASLLANSSEVVQRGRDGNNTVYTFDHVFEGSEQDKFFAITIAPLVEELVSMSTSNSVFMAYGASGTGKTYTMRGTAAEPGVIPRTLDRLYQMLGERQLDHQVLLSYYEVHDNKVYDLLQAARSGKPPANHLPITQLGPSCCLPGLLRCHSDSAEAGRRLYAAASRIRKQAATAVNAESSRSHAIFTVQLVENQQAAAKGRSASLSLVDLAGAEREEQTKHAGSKLRESGCINKSLMVLGRCLNALRYNQALAQRPLGPGGAVAMPRVIPVRESSLTNLFRGVLTGQGNLAISVHVSQRSRDTKLTQTTLEFAAVASRLQVSVAPAAAPAPPPPTQLQQQAAKQQPGAGTCPSGLHQGVRRPVLPEGKAESCIHECQKEEEEHLQYEQQEVELERGSGDEAGGTVDEQMAPSREACGLASHQQLRSEAQAGEHGPRSAAEDANAALLAGLRAQVEQLQQQLAAAEEQARAVAAAEWEALVVAGREELEEAQQLAAELKEGLAACQRELAAERAAKKALQQQLQAVLAAAEIAHAQGGPLQPQGGLPEAAPNGSVAACSVRPPAGVPIVAQDTSAPFLPESGASANAAPACRQGSCDDAGAQQPLESTRGCAGDGPVGCVRPLRPENPGQNLAAKRPVEQSVAGEPMDGTAAGERVGAAVASGPGGRAPLVRIQESGLDSAAGGAVNAVGVPPPGEWHDGGGNAGGTSGRSEKDQDGALTRRGKRQRGEGGIGADGEQGPDGQRIAGASGAEQRRMADGSGAGKSERRRGKAAGLPQSDSNAEKAGAAEVPGAEVLGATPVAGRTRRKRQALPR